MTILLAILMLTFKVFQCNMTAHPALFYWTGFSTFLYYWEYRLKILCLPQLFQPKRACFGSKISHKTKNHSYLSQNLFFDKIKSSSNLLKNVLKLAVGQPNRSKKTTHIAELIFLNIHSFLVKLLNGTNLKKNKKLEFTPCKAEQPIKGMELQEKEAQKD